MESFFSSFFLLFFHSYLLLNSFHHSIISSGILAFSILHFKGISLSSSLLPPTFLSASARATGSISFPASDSAVCAFSFFSCFFSSVSVLSPAGWSSSMWFHFAAMDPCMLHLHTIILSVSPTYTRTHTPPGTVRILAPA